MANTATSAAIEWSYPYDPGRNPRQLALASSPAEEILYGGAAGGGKTDALLAAGVTMCLMVPNAKVILFRQTYKQLGFEIVPRLQKNLPPHIAVYNGSEHVYRFSNGSTLWLSYLTKDNDLLNYQGAEFQLILFDELTQFKRKHYKYMRSRCRAAGQVADDMAKYGWKPRIISTSNPGGPGHTWVKTMFVDPAKYLPTDATFIGGIDPDDPEEDPAGLKVLAYIPARASDNPFLDKIAYDRQLAGLDPIHRRALRDGDWDILEGVRFSQFRNSLHVVEPEQLPLPLIDYPRGVGVDWGITVPFAALWGCLVPVPGDPDPILVIYREQYETDLTSRQQAELIISSEQPGERGHGRPIPVVLDPSCWRRSDKVAEPPPLDPDTPPRGSMAADYKKVLGGALRKAVNARVEGWALLDELMRVRADGLPRLIIYSTCINLLRTLPAAPRSKHNPNDVDTDCEDHALDALRYLAQLMVRGGVRRTAYDAVSRAALVAAAEYQRAARDRALDVGLARPRPDPSPANRTRIGQTVQTTRRATPAQPRSTQW